jgi:enamine deaminase RidA (YjgF/YER057c/UK114 family)
MTAETNLAKKLDELNLTMPPAPEPKGVYQSLRIQEKMVYTSGHLPMRSDGTLITGRLGENLDVSAGYDAARWAGLGILASLKKALGSLDRVRRVIKVLGVVSCTADFTQQPAVINGCSELLAAVFGADQGIGARSALGTNALPLGVAVEIEAVFEIES